MRERLIGKLAKGLAFFGVVIIACAIQIYVTAGEEAPTPEVTSHVILVTSIMVGLGVLHLASAWHVWRRTSRTAAALAVVVGFTYPVFFYTYFILTKAEPDWIWLLVPAGPIYICWRVWQLWKHLEPPTV